MGPALRYALQQWKREADFCKEEDWVFASPFHAGKKPYWPGTILVRTIRPAARAVGITKWIGWHTFRRTKATQLVAMGESIKTTQDAMRHATPSTTFGIYAQSISEDVLAAQNKVAALLNLETGGEHYAVPA